MSRAVLALSAAALFVSWMGGGAARADEPPPGARAVVERAFFEGRYAALDGLIPSAGPDTDVSERFPLAVRDQRWRLRLPPAEEAPVAARPWEDPALAARWPVVTALLHERERREALGVAGIRSDSPLQVTGKDWLAWQAGLYVRYDPEQDSDKETASAARTAREEAEGLRGRALLFAGLAVLGLLGLAVLAAFLQVPHTRRTP